jgi:hypothetical protein
MPHEERLRQLDRVVAEARDDRLHMNRFCDPAAACGTAFCAAGLAAIDPWFRAETPIGETFRVVETPAGPILHYVADDGTVYDDPHALDSDPGFRFERRLAALFGITPRDANRLFGLGLDLKADPHAVTKAAVRDNIRLLLEGEHARAYATAIDELADDGDALDEPDEFDEDELEDDDEDDED